MPKTLYHISTVNPVFTNNTLMPHENKTIDGETINAIFASDIPPEDNPYIARDSKNGMYGLGDIIIYNNDNIDHSDNKLKLKYPTYAYVIQDPNDEFKLHKQNAETEYTLQNTTITGTNNNSAYISEIREINDVTSLCNKHHIFSDIHKKGIGRSVSIMAKIDKSKALELLQEAINNGDLIYHNEYANTNVNPDYCKNTEKTKSVNLEYY